MDERPGRGHELDNHIDSRRAVHGARVDIGANLNASRIVGGPCETANFTGTHGDRPQEFRDNTYGASPDGESGGTTGLAFATAIGTRRCDGVGASTRRSEPNTRSIVPWPGRCELGNYCARVHVPPTMPRLNHHLDLPPQALTRKKAVAVEAPAVVRR